MLIQTGIVKTMTGLYGRLARALVGGRDIAQAGRLEVIVPERDQHAAALFRESVQADSNLEMDWMWLYTRVSGSTERRYCLQKMLEINPSNTLARREFGGTRASRIRGQ